MRYPARGSIATFVAGCVFIALIVLAMRTDPLAQDIPSRLLPPGARTQDGRRHLLGTDPLGRDVLARLAHGARLSLFVGATSVGGSATLGTALGLASGFLAGRTDRLLMRLVDLQLSFPFMILAIGILAATGPSFGAVIALFVLARWPAYARLARGSVLEIKERAFVAAAQALGASDLRILLKHVAPSCIGPLLVLASFELAGVIIAEASLGFLGVGIAPPTPTWGNMLAGSRNYLRTAWWLVVFPGLAISLTALAANLAGDRLRDHFDPRTRRQQ